MGYGIHGDETSASEAAVPFAYHLAASTDAAVVNALEQTIVVLDPCLNPDGRERIRSMVMQSAGYRANLDNGAMQRGRWPGGRGNHYLFDMNRDWMAGETPETRARWTVLLRYPPQLFVDAHEMSGLDTFLFYPQAAPRNQNLPERLTYWQSRMAREAGDAFDGYGWGYYTREWADALYPGYSDAWGSLTGAIGMLYEQGRTIGAPLKRESGEIVAYRESVHGQIVASYANFLTFAENRKGILRDYAQHRIKASDPGAAGGNRAFVFVPTGDPMRDARFLRTLLEQGIEVSRADAEFDARNVVTVMGDTQDSATFPAGAYIVPAAQGQGALVRTYLELDPKLDAEFLKEERESIERGRGSKVYDVSAWNLARQYGLVESAWVDAPNVATMPAEPASAPAGPVGDLSGAYAWAVDGHDERALRFAARAMERGLQVHVADRDFESDVQGASGDPETRAFPRGSFLLRRHENAGRCRVIDRGDRPLERSPCLRGRERPGARRGAGPRRRTLRAPANTEGRAPLEHSGFEHWLRSRLALPRRGIARARDPRGRTGVPGHRSRRLHGVRRSSGGWLGTARARGQPRDVGPCRRDARRDRVVGVRARDGGLQAVFESPAAGCTRRSRWVCMARGEGARGA